MMKVPERFRSKIVLGQGPDDCDEWIGSKNEEGYGHFLYEGNPQNAHHVFWELTYGSVPSGKMICHHCDNPGCVKLEHLFLGTHADNMRDKVAKGRARKPKPSRFTSKQYLEAIVEIGIPSQAYAAWFFGLTTRTLRNYETYGAPTAIAMLLLVMIEKQISIAEMNRLMKRRGGE